MYFVKGGPVEKLTTQTTDNVLHWFVPDSNMACQFVSGYPDKPLIDWVNETFITPDKHVIDIGVDVGTYAVIFGKKAKHVYAFRSPATFCYLAANTALHGLIDKISPMSHEIRNAISADRVTLDNLHIRNVGFIRIDLTGFDVSLFRGMQGTCRFNGMPPMLLECGSVDEDVQRQIFGQLICMGYRIIPVNGYPNARLAVI